MVGGGFPLRAVVLAVFGLFDVVVEAFFVVEWDGGRALGEDAVGEVSALVEEGEGDVEGLAEGQLGAAQTITLALVLELIFAVLELEGEVFRQGSGVVEAEDEVELLGAAQHGAVGIVGVLGRPGEALIVELDELGQEGVGDLDVADIAQAQFLDQAVLEGLVGSLDAALGLGGVGVDGLDIEGPDGAGELGQLPLMVGVVDAEDAVLVGVEGHGPSILAEVWPEGFQVGLGGLCRDEAQGHQATGGIIDEDDQRTPRATRFEPVMGRAIDLDQFPETGAAGSARMDAGLALPAGYPEPVGNHPLAQGLH